MRNIIKKILKEDFNPEDFSWVDTELEPVRDDKHRVEVIDKTIAKVKEYKGWRIYKDKYDGVVYWIGNGEYGGMATPEWDGEFIIPIDVMWNNGDDYDNVKSIYTPHFKYVVEVEDWYSKNYFEKVYQALTDFINRRG
jgi:hypothetical protein